MRRRWLWGCAHAVLALLGLTASVFLALAGGGHPPPIILLPLVWALWLVGHLLIWAAAGLARRGRGDTAERWPWSLRLALIGCGVGAALGAMQLVISALLGKPWPFHGGLWWQTLAIWGAHTGGFAGLLLRKRWAGAAAAVLAGGWAWLLGSQLYDALRRSRHTDPLELGAAVLAIALLCYWALRLLRSEAVRGFLRR